MHFVGFDEGAEVIGIGGGHNIMSIFANIEIGFLAVAKSYMM